jgi:hypothetical protein
MSVSTDASGMPGTPDMTQPKMFGDSCTSPNQCSSNICVFTGTGGVCSATCPLIGCPSGYACYGVLGAIDPGEVANVCVPESNLLCTPCAQDVECGGAGDTCLPYPTGKFCGRDCSTISCPPTYTCKSLGADGGAPSMQCVPNNNSCDCSPANAGMTISCNITTPNGTACPGTETCNGGQGWGACAPASTTDLPDDNFVDSNCDGIDGDILHAIFVDTLSGNDFNAGTMEKPVDTIAKGMALAQSTAGITQVLVSKGSYAPTTLVSGVRVYGGYDASHGWARAAGNTTTITGGSPALDANGISAETHVELFTIIGADATTGPGNSSYGVRIFDSAGPVYLHNCSIAGGQATAGAAGANGVVGADGSVGGAGGGGCESCSSPSLAGAPGPSSCNPGGSGGGGVDGTGTANPGVKGSGPAAGGVGTPGAGCDKSATLCATTCSCGTRTVPTGGGTGGSGSNGTNGPAASAVGTVTGNIYTPADGIDGADGTDGSGGGGGGGGGGSNGPCFCNAYTGGGGGGGGGAGCHGTHGAHGGGGGGSFAVFVDSSTVHVELSTLIAQPGGAGGAGGAGKAGGAAGGAGSPGAGDSDGQQGGPGGPGGSGGLAGSGSGGSGGPSLCIFGKASTIFDQTNSKECAQGGAGGIGGGGNGYPLGAAPNGALGASGVYQE